MALREAGLDEALVRLIAHVHMATRCSVVYGSFEGSSGMSKGLRQGCAIAPLVYLAWSIRFLRIVNLRLSERWDQQHATVYADDKHLAWEIESVESLDRAVKELGVVMSVLGELGMEISFGTCEAVLSLKGLKQQQATKKYVKARNGVPHLVVRTDKEVLTPIKNEIAYLGVLVSYGSFEFITVHRCRQSWLSFKSLGRALRTNGVLSLLERMRIYVACVWPVVEYGLIGVGVDGRGLRLIESTVAQQLRKVLRTHERAVSNQQVFERAGLEPRDILHERLAAQAQRVMEAEPQSIVSRQHMRAVQIQEFFQRTVDCSGSTLTPVSAASGCPCPVCGIYFDSEAGVALHLQRRHAEVHMSSKISFDRAKHTADGLPKCVFCLTLLGDMQAMEKHLAAGGCSVVKQAVAEGQDLEQLRTQLRAARQQAPSGTSVASSGTGLGVHDLDSLSVLDQPSHVIVREHASDILSRSPCCLLCGQRTLDVRRIKTHWQAIHKRSGLRTRPMPDSFVVHCQKQYRGRVNSATAMPRPLRARPSVRDALSGYFDEGCSGMS